MLRVSVVTFSLFFGTSLAQRRLSRIETGHRVSEINFALGAERVNRDGNLNISALDSSKMICSNSQQNCHELYDCIKIDLPFLIQSEFPAIDFLELPQLAASKPVLDFLKLTTNGFRRPLDSTPAGFNDKLFVSCSTAFNPYQNLRRQVPFCTHISNFSLSKVPELFRYCISNFFGTLEHFLNEMLKCSG